MWTILEFIIIHMLHQPYQVKSKFQLLKYLQKFNENKNVIKINLIYFDKRIIKSSQLKVKH